MCEIIIEVIKQCTRCGNNDEAFFYYGSKGWYCRKCIRFMMSEKPEDTIKVVDSEYKLSFSLTNEQFIISEKLRKLIDEHKNVLLEAVCGAGKTELVYSTIASELEKGHKVGFAIARRQVVLEIAERLQTVFTKLKVIPVCQGHTKETIAPLIVCTTHQLYRYRNYFDLLIIDEPDAFPFKGNETLQGIALASCKGSRIYLTATPDTRLKQQVTDNTLEHLYLPKRPTGKKLIVPKVLYGPKIYLIVRGIITALKVLKENKPLIIFTPTISLGRKMAKIISIFIPCCNIDSTVKNKDILLNDFRKHKYKICVSTTVLERGVTIKSANIIVYNADSNKFDEASLTQMAGRVGRSISDPKGECVFLAFKRKESIDECLKSIIKANSY